MKRREGKKDNINIWYLVIPNDDVIHYHSQQSKDHVRHYHSQQSVKIFWTPSYTYYNHICNIYPSQIIGLSNG